jgi:hypothetical protein
MSVHSKLSKPLHFSLNVSTDQMDIFQDISNQQGQGPTASKGNTSSTGATVKTFERRRKVKSMLL